MRIAIIADIHGNYEALKKVLADIDGAAIDRTISLGDNIGYGPSPEAVVKEIIARRIPSVIGNHELAIKSPKYSKWFNPLALESLKITQTMLSQETIAYIEALQPFFCEHNCRFVHGFPPDSPIKYLFQISDEQLTKAFTQFDERLCFVGHTHHLEMISFDGQALNRIYPSKGTVDIDPSKRYLINVGSVGQPRDGSNQAKYVIWDSEANTIEIKSTPYDIAAVSEKIIAAGMPAAHADRLW